MSANAEQFFKTYLEMPADFWVKVLIAAVVLLLFFVVLKRLAHIAQFVIALAVLAIIGVIGYKWVRYGGEPEFLSPVVNFFHSLFY